LTFTGVKVGFVTERQLERGIGPDVPVLFVPNIVHLSDAAFETLKHYKGHIVLVGNGNLLSRNEYGIARNTGQWAQSKAEQIGFECGRTSWRDLWQALSEKLKALGVKPLVEVRDEKGARIWGVAWRCVETPRGVVINLCNYRHDPVKVRLWSNGEKITGIDLLGGEKLPRSFTLSPLQIRLLLVR
jgi:hypothetical protein